MKNFLPFFSRGSSWKVGIDLGETNTKIVCLREEGGQRQLTAHALFPKSSTDAFRNMVTQPEISRGDIRVNIEHPSIKVRRLDLPKVPPEEVNEVVKWGLKDVVSGNVEDYVIRYDVLLDNGLDAEKQSYLVYVVARSALVEHLAFLGRQGLSRPRLVAPNAGALVVGFCATHALGSEDRSVLIDMGSSMSLFTVLAKQGLLFSRPLVGVSGELVTRQIARNLGISEVDAEKKKLGFRETDEPTEEELKLKNTIYHFLQRASLEIQRSIDAYTTQFPGHEVARIHFTGGGSFLSGLVSYVGSTLNIDTLHDDPFAGIDVGSFGGEAIFESKRPFYSLALGLALD